MGHQDVDRLSSDLHKEFPGDKLFPHETSNYTRSFAEVWPEEAICIRREELCRLKVRDVQSREGVMHFRVQGKGDKIRFIPVHPHAQRLIEEYLALAGHALDAPGPVFRPVKNNRTPEGLRRGIG